MTKERPMMFRSTALFTTSSLFCMVISTTAHAGEHSAASDVAPATATLPGAVLAPTPHRRPAPKAGAGRVVGEVLAGAAVGAGVAVGTGALAYASMEDPSDDSWDLLGNTFAAVAIGGAVYPLGVGLGVGLAGNHGDVHGSYGAAIGGAYLGSLGGVLLGSALGPDTLGGSAGLLGFLAGAPLGAVITHTMTLDYDQPGTGLVNVSGNRASLSIPAVSVTADPLRPNGTLTSIRLMDGRF
jgi:hypothetical protein